VGSLNQVVAAGCPDDLLMVDLLKCWKFSDGGPITGQLVGADRIWDVEFAEQASRERPCHFGLSVALQQDVEHDPVFVHGSPQPVTDTANCRTDFVHLPPGTPLGFPVTQHFSNERREVDVPLPQRVAADRNTALLEQFLHIPVAEREAWYSQIACWTMLTGKRWR
jgi:hypothetical protein